MRGRLRDWRGGWGLLLFRICKSFGSVNVPKHLKLSKGSKSQIMFGSVSGLRYAIPANAFKVTPYYAC